MDPDACLLDLSTNTISPLAINHPQTSCSPEVGDCVICSQPAHGIHFGVLACRACAAFFRRSVVMEKKYKCRRAEENCDVTIDERYLCRLCRYNKCIRVGMTTDNVQFNRDRLSSSAPKEKKKTIAHMQIISSPYDFMDDQEPSTSSAGSSPRTDESVIKFGNASRLDEFKKEMYTTDVKPAAVSKKMVIDMHPLSESIGNIFSTFQPKFEYATYSALQRMLFGLKYYRRRQSMEPETIGLIDFEEIGPWWREMAEHAAEFFQHCEEFDNLELSEKRIMFRTSWYAVQRLERVVLSLQLFGEEVFTRRKLIIFNKYAICDTTAFDPKFISDFDGESFKKLFTPFCTRILIEVARPIQRLQLTDMELVYMMCQLIWHVEGRGVSDSTTRVADEFRERISQELHDYYIHTMQIPNYAGRLFTIMGLVHLLENLVQERGKMIEMWRLFDIFKFEYSHEDVIEMNSA